MIQEPQVPVNWRGRLPYYRRVRGWVVRRMRTSPTVQHVVSIVSRQRRSRQVPTMQFKVGACFPAEHERSMPVVLFVGLGLDQDTARDAARRIADVQLMTAAFRPLFVIDTAIFSVFREHGFAFEYIMSRRDWEQLDDCALWTDYVLERVEHISAAYGASSVVPLPADGAACIPYEALLALGAAGTP